MAPFNRTSSLPVSFPFQALSGKVDDEVSNKRTWWKNNKTKPSPIPPTSYRPSPATSSAASARSSSDHGDGGLPAQAIRRGPSSEASTSRIPEQTAPSPPQPIEEPAVVDEDEDDEDEGGKHSEIAVRTTMSPRPRSPPPPLAPLRPDTLGRLASTTSSDTPLSPTSPSDSSSARRTRRWSEKLTSSQSTKARPHPATSPTSSSRPLAHTVIRSLPLGSMVALGDQQQKKEDARQPRKLNDEAARHDSDASAIVASLFQRNEAASAIQSSASTSSVTSESSRPRLSLFGRRTPSAHAVPSINAVPPTPVERSTNPIESGDERGRNASRLNTRAMSPFFRSGRSRSRARSPSPGSVGALRGTRSEVADSDSDDDGKSESEVGARDSNFDASIDLAEGGSSFIDDPDDDDGFDEETELNTEQNAEASLIPGESGETPLSDLYQDIPPELGLGPNVVLPEPEPFPVRTTTNTPALLPIDMNRPEYGRDRCTLSFSQGDPDGVAEKKGHRQRRYVVASDLSEESGYAVEWAIGTVARDGDEIWVVNVCEDETKVDPKDASAQDRVEKIRNQKERQTLAQLLSRQVLGLLQRTNLNVDVVCQAVHTKNARHLLLDLIDFLDPTLVIVGSRGLGKLKGTILGSMSHYLVQKSSVPVMIARRRLKRNLKRTDPMILRQGARVPLARAGIEKTTGGKEQEDIIDAADIEAEGDEHDVEGEKKRLEEHLPPSA